MKFKFIMLSICLSAGSLQAMQEENQYATEEKEILYNPRLTVESLRAAYDYKELLKHKRWLERKQKWAQETINYFKQKGLNSRAEKPSEEAYLISQKLSIVKQALQNNSEK